MTGGYTRVLRRWHGILGVNGMEFAEEVSVACAQWLRSILVLRGCDVTDHAVRALDALWGEGAPPEDWYRCGEVIGSAIPREDDVECFDETDALFENARSAISYACWQRVSDDTRNAHAAVIQIIDYLDYLDGVRSHPESSLVLADCVDKVLEDLATARHSPLKIQEVAVAFLAQIDVCEM